MVVKGSSMNEFHESSELRADWLAALCSDLTVLSFFKVKSDFFRLISPFALPVLAARLLPG